MEEAQSLYNIELELDTTLTREDNILILRPGKYPKMDKKLRAEGLDLEGREEAEAYAILVEKDRVIISAHEGSGVFYAVQTLKQLLYQKDGMTRVRGVKIMDWPSMKYRWVQDDWNRGPIPTLEYAKKQIRTLSEYKINGYCIYSENMFESRKHPNINSYGGTITPGEIRELIGYARKYHMEVIPQQQTFGHMHYVLRKQKYAHLGERHGSQILSPAEEGSYAFVNDYLEEIVPLFESEFFHIGCDETFELGLGKSRERVADESFSGVYLSYLKGISELPSLENKKLLFWGEIALDHPESLDRLPDNLIAVPWGYRARENYESFIRPYSDRGLPTIVSPSAFYGGCACPDFNARLTNIRNFVRDGQKLGSLGMMNTTWDDLGDDIFAMGWYSLVFSAAASWQEGEADIESFKSAFDWAFYRNAGGNHVAEAIGKLSAVHDSMRNDFSRISVEMIYNDPFHPMGANLQNSIQNTGKAELMRLLCEDAIDLIVQAGDGVRIHRETIDPLMFASKRLEFIFHKSILAGQMSDLYDAFVRNDDEGNRINTAIYDLVMPYASRLGSLRDMTKELKMYHEDLWKTENRPFHWDVVEAKYMHLLMAWHEMELRIREDLRYSEVNPGEHLSREEVGFHFDRPQEK